MEVWLFVPGHDRRKVQKALQSAADAVIIDWEDAVPPDQRALARATTAELLGAHRAGPRAVVRVNSPRTAEFAADLAAVRDLTVSAVMIPKVEEPAEVDALAALALPLVPMVESALGLECAYQIASHPDVERLTFGALDYLADLGAEWELDSAALGHARARLAVASRAARRIGPLDGVYPHVTDLAGLAHDTGVGRRLGCAGRSVIHPNHIPVVRAAYAPSPDQIARAQAIVAAASTAMAAGRAAIQLPDGTFIDPPVVKWAERVLASVKS